MYVCLYTCGYIMYMYKCTCVCDYIYVCVGVCVFVSMCTCEVRGAYSLSLCRIQVTDLAAGVSAQPTISPPHVPFFECFVCQIPQRYLVDRALLVSVLMNGTVFNTVSWIASERFGSLIQRTGWNLRGAAKPS